MQTILVVDDHPETVQVVDLILRQNGYTVLTAENGRQAIEMAMQHLPDLILMDVMMPEMSGDEACREIRQIPALEQTPIIMFTVKAQVDDKWAGFQAGADDYLVKPADPEDLLARIATLISRRSGGEAPKAYPSQSEFDDLVDSAPLRGSQLILFIGARGGVGATTAAIHFTATMASLSQPAMLVDLDMTQGHIALYLKQKIRGGLNALTHLQNADLRMEIPQHIVNYQEGWQLLLSQVNLDRRLPFLSQQQLDILVKTLMRPDRWVIADLGCGIRPEHEPLILRASHIFVCLRPERIAIAAARLLLRRLAALRRDETALKPLMIDFAERRNLSRQAVEEFLQYPLAGIVPIEPAQMIQFVNNAQLFTKGNADNAAASALRQVAAELLVA